MYAGRIYSGMERMGGGLNMKIVANGYTWEAPDTVKVGDKVLLPVFWDEYDTWEGEVTALESDYDGSCKSIIKVMED